MATEVAVIERGGALAQQDDFSPNTVLRRLTAVQDLMRQAMEKDVDYGVVPGTGSKPTLLKSGAEKLAVMFRLAPKYRTTKTFHDNGHLTVESTCQIFDMNESFLGEASAMCSTRESKYAWRKSSRKCPACGKETILRSKFPPREDPSAPPGWYCFAKKGGCGQNFAAGDSTITSQTEARVPNEDLADSFNTVIRIAEKRSFIAAIRLVTGSSSLFDEENPATNEREEPAHAPQASAPETTYEPQAKVFRLRDIPEGPKWIVGLQKDIAKHGCDLAAILDLAQVGCLEDMPFELAKKLRDDLKAGAADLPKLPH